MPRLFAQEGEAAAREGEAAARKGEEAALEGEEAAREGEAEARECEVAAWEGEAEVREGEAEGGAAREGEAVRLSALEEWKCSCLLRLRRSVVRDTIISFDTPPPLVS